MEVNAAALSGINTTYQAGFNEAFELASTVARQVATEIPITGSAINLTGIKAFSKLREWIGPRLHKSLEGMDLTVKPRPFEDTVDVKRTDIEDDQFGQHYRSIQEMGTAAGQLDSELICGVLEGTEAQLGYDGKKLAANDHKMGGATYDNLGATVLSRAALKAGWDWFGTLRNEAGAKLSLRPTHLITADYGAAFWQTKILLENQQIVDTGVMVDNETKALVQHLPLPHITSPTFWALLVLNRAWKPVFLFPRTKPELVAKIDPAGDRAFEEDVFSWGTRYRVNVSPGLWQLCYVGNN